MGCWLLFWVRSVAFWRLKRGSESDVQNVEETSTCAQYAATKNQSCTDLTLIAQDGWGPVGSESGASSIRRRLNRQGGLRLARKPRSETETGFFFPAPSDQLSSVLPIVIVAGSGTGLRDGPWQVRAAEDLMKVPCGPGIAPGFRKSVPGYVVLACRDPCCALRRNKRSKTLVVKFPRRQPARRVACS
jgi:hypothetical protein